MFVSPSEALEPCPFVVRAEQSLQALKHHVTAHINRESHLCRLYSEWQETWMNRTNQLRQQINELEARLSPWIARHESVRLSIVARADESPAEAD